MTREIYPKTSDLEIRESDIHGRGVFARRDFKQYELIEVCPIIAAFKADDRPEPLDSFPFEWSKTMSSIAGGYGSFYNHSTDPNADFTLNKKRKLLTFRALYPIINGEEITIDYGDDLWFKPV